MSQPGITSSLDKTLTYENMASWRIHWVTCELYNIENEFKRRTYNMRPKEYLTEINDKLITLRNKYQRILWEIVTMIGNDDYESDLQKLLNDHPKYIAMVNQFKVVEDLLVKDLATLNEQEMNRLINTFKI